jgi:hypothetical protein
MLFMVIERFKNQDPIPVYRRVRSPPVIPGRRASAEPGIHFTTVFETRWISGPAPKRVPE